MIIQGIWSGMLAGTLLQTVVLLVMTLRTNWEKEVTPQKPHTTL